MVNFRRLFKSFGYAFKGLFKVFREEQNLRFQSFFAVLAISLGFVFGITATEWCFIVFSITLVLIMEVVNSAVERVADVLRPRINNYIKEIKDITAAAVMVASIGAVIIGLIVFFPYLYKIFVQF